MTSDEQALLTLLTSGPANDSDLPTAQSVAAANFVGRSITRAYPRADAQPGIQWELTVNGQMAVAAPQLAEEPTQAPA